MHKYRYKFRNWKRYGKTTKIIIIITVTNKHTHTHTQEVEAEVYSVLLQLAFPLA
jgi:hypothetical protein